MAILQQELDITFELIEDTFPQLQRNIKEYEQHCVTYLIHNNTQIYIGETSHLKNRLKDHTDSKKQYKLAQTKIIFSDFFNKSAVYDLESRLINYFYADNKFDLLNIKKDQASHNYYLKKEINDQLFKKVWEKLRSKGLTNNTLTDLENRALFKYSPFKEFSDNQLEIIDQVIKLTTSETDIEDNGFDGSVIVKREINTSGSKLLVTGGPGTGKTLLIVKIVHDLVKRYGIEGKRIAICIPQINLRNTFKTMFKDAKLKVQIIKPIDLSKVSKNHFDFLIVDEAHRLKKYFSKQSKDLKHLQNGKTELDYALETSKNLVLMYDDKQTVRPADITPEDIKNLKGFKKPLQLTEQFRVKKGATYLSFLEKLLQIDPAPPKAKDLGDYPLMLVDDINQLYGIIKKHDKEVGLSRLASGYYKEWISKKNLKLNDFESEGLKLPWNRVAVGWIRSETSLHEVGCIHTLQGEDLNYAGVIFGDEIYFDPKDQKIKIHPQNYRDKNGTPVKGTDSSHENLIKYIKNIYYVLLSRGMFGTYVFVKDKNLREYIKKSLKT
jgi:uncharacterized protein